MTISADQIPAQAQDKQPALESEMNPQPQYDRESYQGSGKLKGKVISRNKYTSKSTQQ